MVQAIKGRPISEENKAFKPGNAVILFCGENEYETAPITFGDGESLNIMLEAMLVTERGFEVVRDKLMPSIPKICGIPDKEWDKCTPQQIIINASRVWAQVNPDNFCEEAKKECTPFLQTLYALKAEAKNQAEYDAMTPEQRHELKVKQYELATANERKAALELELKAAGKIPEEVAEIPTLS